MGLFSKILDKLGIGGASASPAAGATPVEAPAAGGTSPAAVNIAPADSSTTSVAQPRAVPVVDVVAQLEQKASAHSEKLNWRTSIVDLLKLLDIDSSLTARKELATELGCPANLMADSAQMNMWLHKAVLARVAANGGNVPADLLD